jgi:hypothetical protein
MSLSAKELFTKNLPIFRDAVAKHDAKCEHKAWGIGLHSFDMQRMEIDEEEELWDGVIAKTWMAAQPQRIVVLCDGNYNRPKARVAAVSKELVDA